MDALNVPASQALIDKVCTYFGGVDSIEWKKGSKFCTCVGATGTSHLMLSFHVLILVSPTNYLAVGEERARSYASGNSSSRLVWRCLHNCISNQVQHCFFSPDIQDYSDLFLMPFCQCILTPSTSPLVLHQMHLWHHQIWRLFHHLFLSLNWLSWALLIPLIFLLLHELCLCHAIVIHWYSIRI